MTDNGNALLAAVQVFIGCPYCSESTGTLCASHRRDLRAALAAAEAVPLDVERLTIAIGRALRDGDIRPTWHYDSKANAAHDAELIAREYVALRSPDTEDGYDHDAPSPGFIDTGSTEGGRGSE